MKHETKVSYGNSKTVILPATEQDKYYWSPSMQSVDSNVYLANNNVTSAKSAQPAFKSKK